MEDATLEDASELPSDSDSPDTAFEKVATPVIKPGSGEHTCPLPPIEITTATPGARIYYTWDYLRIPADPTIASAHYVGSFAIQRTAVVKARAFRDGFEASDVATVKYVVDRRAEAPTAPMISPGTGTYSSDPTVTLSSSPGATICYVLGSDLYTMCEDGRCAGSASLYSAPFVVTPKVPYGTTVTARACFVCSGPSPPTTVIYRR